MFLQMSTICVSAKIIRFFNFYCLKLLKRSRRPTSKWPINNVRPLQFSPSVLNIAELHIQNKWHHIAKSHLTSYSDRKYVKLAVPRIIGHHRSVILWWKQIIINLIADVASISHGHHRVPRNLLGPQTSIVPQSIVLFSVHPLLCTKGCIVLSYRHQSVHYLVSFIREFSNEQSGPQQKDTSKRKVTLCESGWTPGLLQLIMIGSPDGTTHF